MDRGVRERERDRREGEEGGKEEELERKKVGMNVNYFLVGVVNRWGLFLGI